MANIRWTDADKAFVRENAGTMSDQAIADALAERKGERVTLHAVRKIRQRLGLRKKGGRGRCELFDSQ